MAFTEMNYAFWHTKFHIKHRGEKANLQKSPTDSSFHLASVQILAFGWQLEHSSVKTISLGGW